MSDPFGDNRDPLVLAMDRGAWERHARELHALRAQVAELREAIKPLIHGRYGHMWDRARAALETSGGVK